jgi:hypothetical protein
LLSSSYYLSPFFLSFLLTASLPLSLNPPHYFSSLIPLRERQ